MFKRIKFKLCDFCKYDTNLNKEQPKQCQECIRHNNFEEKPRMSLSQRQAYEDYLKTKRS